MKDFDKKKILIFLLLVALVIVGLRNNYRLLKREENKDDKNQISGLASQDKEEKSIEIPEESSEDKNLEDKEPKEKNQVEKIYVHITGAVKKPGLYILDPGARLNDLIKMCQGLKKDADIRKINLSMILKDQMRLHILALGEEEFSSDFDNSSSSMPLEKESLESKLNVNKASKEELMSLPGIGEKRALDIIDYRKKSSFKSLEDLKNISGIGDKSIDKLKDYVIFD
ncbi:MAG: helix-hairpin-helix domain-containing protein [Tissierellia bacterium]|nr:helix-hairpin-helix domain-containing protein [Tissierellia bacterium]